MSSRKNGNKAQGKSATEAVSSSTTPRRRASMGTVAERLVAKAATAENLVRSAMSLCEARGVPTEILRPAQDVVFAVNNWHAQLVVLRDSGWQPTSQSNRDIVEGDLIAVARVKEYVATYSYIPGVLDGTAELVACKVVPTGNRSARVLVATRSATTGQETAYGYIPRNHLVRR